ncbi:MAG: hypothetical protein WAK60_00950 [Sedimentisphaerales bacterium]
MLLFVLEKRKLLLKREMIALLFRNAKICSAGIAIKFAGFGNPSWTLVQIKDLDTLGSTQAIAETHKILQMLRRMAPPEDPFPEVQL